MNESIKSKLGLAFVLLSAVLSIGIHPIKTAEFVARDGVLMEII